MVKARLLVVGISLAITACGKVETTNSKPDGDGSQSTSENDDFNIVGGTNAAAQPFFASLRNDNTPGGQWCGGTFISTNVILTAAHCLEGMLVKNLHVAVGETRNLANQTTSRRAKIERVIIHPDYNPETLKNDVALLFVDPKERAKLGPITAMALNANPALPESLRNSLKFSGNAGPLLQAFGFGNLTNYGFLPSITLQQAKLNTIPMPTCRTGSGLSNVDNSQLCAGFFAAGSVDTCQGDSGGPLVVTLASGKSSLAGITSFGNGCALANSPGVYTRVSHFKPWIEQKMNQPETVDIQSPRDPNRYWQVKDLVSQRCFSEDNQTIVGVYNNESSQAVFGIAPKYNKGNVILSNNSPNQFFASSCTSQFQIPSSLANSTTTVDLRVGLAQQSNDGTYSSRVRVSGQDFTIEKTPADVIVAVNCKENQAAGRSMAFVSEGGMAMLSLGEKYYVGSLLSGTAAISTTGSLISSCSVPSNAAYGLTSATVEIRSAQSPSAQYGKDSTYASVVIKDSLGRDHRFGLKGEEYNFENDASGLDPSSALVMMSATLRPNRQTYSVKLQNVGLAPVINWELQCNAAFTSRLRAQAGTLSPVRSSSVISGEVQGLTGATDRAGWHSLGYAPTPYTSPIPGVNGRIGAGKTVEMLITVNPAAASTLACSINNEDAVEFGNPLAVASRELIAQRIFKKKDHRLPSGHKRLLKILGLSH